MKEVTEFVEEKGNELYKYLYINASSTEVETLIQQRQALLTTCEFAVVA